MNKLLLLTLAILGFNTRVAKSQLEKDAKIDLSVSIFFDQKKLPDSLVLNTYPSGSSWDGIVRYVAIRKNNNNFKFSFPSKSSPILFLLSYVDSAGSRVDIGQYYAETNDNVKIGVYETSGKDSSIFRGNGAAKYNLINKVKRDEEDFIRTTKNLAANLSSKELDKYLNQHFLLIKEAINKKKQLIQNFSDEISRDMKLLIGYQFANYEQQWRAQILYGYIKSYNTNNINKEILRNSFNINYKQFLESSEEISTNSYNHYRSLLGMFKLKSTVNSINGEANIIEFYNSLKEYSNAPKIRERILTQFVMARGVISSFTNASTTAKDSLIEDATKYFVSAIGLALASKIIDLKPGTAFFDSTYINLKGQNFDTYTLRGKVFIMDLWGIGCTGCAQFHKMFHKEIWPHLKENKNFEFLSVSIDETKERWEIGLNQGLYSSQDYLNVSIGEIPWLTHPFIKHYRINGIPFLLLIDKNGKIIRKIENTLNPKNLLEMINKEI